MNFKCDGLTNMYPQLSECIPSIKKAFELICQTYKNGGRVYVCGNGGSEADSRHIVGELMKGFEKRRPVKFSDEIKKNLSQKTTVFLEEKLQDALPSHSLSCETSLITAIINDISADIIFAQQIHGYGRRGDLLIGISTSGNAENVCYAAELASAMGLHTVSLTGRDGGKVAKLCDVSICVPATNTAQVQELHLPIYHALCREVESYFFEH